MISRKVRRTKKPHFMVKHVVIIFTQKQEGIGVGHLVVKQASESGNVSLNH